MIDNNKSLIVIVPCYNEALRFPIRHFCEYISEHKNLLFCFVDDGSTDSTAEMLKDLKIKHNDSISILQLSSNQGKAEAIRQGVLFVLNGISPKYIGYMDADLATPLSEVYRLNTFIHENEKIRFIFGSRVSVFGSNIQRLPIRHYGGRVIATAVDLILGMKIYDTQCGLKIFDRGMATDLFREPFLTRWFFDVEVFARLKLLYSPLELSYQLRELPINNWVEMGASKVNLGDICRIPLDLVKIYIKYKKVTTSTKSIQFDKTKEHLDIDHIQKANYVKLENFS
jgi:dolichyl-phosphate beta-glucosyltransferase